MSYSQRTGCLIGEFQYCMSTLAEVTQYDGNEIGGVFLYLHHPCQARIIAESRILLGFKIPVPVLDIELEWLISRTSDLLRHPLFKCCALQQQVNQWWLYQDYRWDWLKLNLPEALAAQRRLAIWLSESPCDADDGGNPLSLSVSFKMLGSFV